MPRDYEKEARDREFSYFQAEDEAKRAKAVQEGPERLGAKRRIQHGIPNAATQDTVIPAKTSEGRILGKGLGPQDRWKNSVDEMRTINSRSWMD